MTTPIGKSNATSGTTAPAKGPAPAAKAEPTPKLGADSFLRTPPTAAQLAAMRAAIAALDGVPPAPKGKEALKAWVEQTRPIHEAADKALSGLRSAEFFHKTLPEAEVDAAGDKVYALGDKLRDAEEATGLRAPTKPADPTRPLFGNSKAVQGWMGNNGFTAIVGLFALPIAAVIDVADAATRPLQAVAYPGELVKYKAREAEYKKEQAKAK